MKNTKWHAVAYWVIHAIWGFPTFIIGCFVALYMLITNRKPKVFGYAVYFESKLLKGCGFEAGPFFVVSQDCANNLSLKQHEHGHGIQTLWWGPLMLFVISIPSAVRFHYRNIVYKWQTKRFWKGKITRTQYAEWVRKIPPYESIWFEKQATKLGEKYFTER